MHLKRIMVIGGAGAGKTTIARQIKEITGLPIVHIDALFFYDNWKLFPKVEIHKKVNDVIKQDTWIFEGNLQATFAKRIERADMVVFVDIPTHIRLWRVLMRTYKYYGKTRPEHPATCIEGFSIHFFYICGHL